MIDRSETQWYRDAVIYQLHVKSFFDANNDGIGDFVGVTQKLDYIKDLGATAIWVMPFYPSPLRDDGYDISDYRGINPSYGVARDFKAFVKAAHDRNIRVITELVINHTSDQHPWFQRARKAKPGSAARDFYVWSDTDELYKDTRIIFLDTEKSNWTWDEEAKAYYWHRFYSHQPDLNFDNPRVIEAVLDTMRFWLDLGRRRAAARRHPLPLRARRHQLREPRRNPRRAQDDPCGGRQGLSRPHAARRSQPMAGGDRAIFRRRRRMPHGFPLSADAAHLHGAGAGGSAPRHRHHAPDPGDPRRRAMGDLSAQPRRDDARNGHRPRARLPLEVLRRRQARAHQSRHPPPPGAAAGQRPAQDRAAELAAPLHARHAVPVLRRRDRHGRQHLSRRPRRRAHADAMVGRPQRRLQPRRSGQAFPPRHSGSDLRLSRRQRRGTARQPHEPAELDCVG